MPTIDYPFLPTDRTILYVAADNPYMQEARAYAREHSLDDTVKTASIIVKDAHIIGRGANGSGYHQKHGCKRAKLGVPTGHGYELCEGCHPKNHSEPRAITDAAKNGYDTVGADLYLWGHWWACARCWSVIIDAGIENVYLLEGSEWLFSKKHPDNIIGRQFA